MNRCFVAVVILFAGGLTPVMAQNEPKSAKPEPEVKPSTPSTAPAPTGPLGVLDMFTGTWNITERHLNTLGEVIATVKGTEVAVWVLDNRVLRRDYITNAESVRFHAAGTFTWSVPEKKYVGVWFDNVSSNGPTFSRGEFDEAAGTWSFVVEATAADGAKARYRIVDQFTDAEHRIATTYQIVGDEVIKRLEVAYERAAPCPAAQSVRVIGYPGEE